MSDFCFLFLSVERRHTREVKTLSYDSGEMWTWRFTFLFNFRGAQLSRCTFGAKFLAFLLPWSFFCRRAPSQGVAVWAVRRKKSHPRSPKRETFQNINYHSSSSAKYAKKMPNTKWLCELEIIWRENTIKQSVKASKRIVECLSAESNVTQHFLFLLLLMCDTKTAKRATRLFGCSTKCVFVVVWAVFDWDFWGNYRDLNVPSDDWEDFFFSFGGTRRCELSWFFGLWFVGWLNEEICQSSIIYESLRNLCKCCNYIDLDKLSRKAHQMKTNSESINEIY